MTRTWTWRVAARERRAAEGLAQPLEGDRSPWGALARDRLARCRLIACARAERRELTRYPCARRELTGCPCERREFTRELCERRTFTSYPCARSELK